MGTHLYEFLTKTLHSKNLNYNINLEVVVKIVEVGGKDDVVDDSVVQGFSSAALTTSISSLIFSRVSPLELLERSGVAMGAHFPSSKESCRDTGLYKNILK